MAVRNEATRSDLVGRAFRLEWLTAAWMAVEAAVAIGSGISAQSLSLVAFGADSLIELASARVLLWRLRIELRQGAKFPEAVERRASNAAGALLFALAAYVVASPPPVFGRARVRSSRRRGWPWWYWRSRSCGFSRVQRSDLPIRSEAKRIRADAIESIACGYLSAVIALGLLAQLLFGAWWIDSATSLAIVVLLVKEGREA